MNRLMLSVLLIIPFSLSAFPLDITISWDAVPTATKYTPGYQLPSKNWNGKSTKLLTRNIISNVNIGDDLGFRVNACRPHATKPPPAMECSPFTPVFIYTVKASDQAPPGVMSVPKNLKVFVTPKTGRTEPDRTEPGNKGHGREVPRTETRTGRDGEARK